MKNRDTEVSWSYHEATKHSYASVRADTHVLDWSNRPFPFKIYPAIEPLPLPRDVLQTGVSALSAIAQPLRSPSGEVAPNFQELARILYFSAGITRHRKYPGGEISLAVNETRLQKGICSSFHTLTRRVNPEYRGFFIVHSVLLVISLS
jgi:hypothetical protein